MRKSKLIFLSLGSITTALVATSSFSCSCLNPNPEPKKTIIKESQLRKFKAYIASKEEEISKIYVVILKGTTAEWIYSGQKGVTKEKLDSFTKALNEAKKVTDENKIADAKIKLDNAFKELNNGAIEGKKFLTEKLEFHRIKWQILTAASIENYLLEKILNLQFIVVDNDVRDPHKINSKQIAFSKREFDRYVKAIEKLLQAKTTIEMIEAYAMLKGALEEVKLDGVRGENSYIIPFEYGKEIDEKDDDMKDIVTSLALIPNVVYSPKYPRVKISEEPQWNVYDLLAKCYVNLNGYAVNLTIVSQTDDEEKGTRTVKIKAEKNGKFKEKDVVFHGFESKESKQRSDALKEKHKSMKLEFTTQYTDKKASEAYEIYDHEDVVAKELPELIQYLNDNNLHFGHAEPTFDDAKKEVYLNIHIAEAFGAYFETTITIKGFK